MNYKKNLPLPPSLWKNPWHFIAFGFGAGCLPAPGTFGTLMAVPIYLILRSWPPMYYLLAVVIFSLFCIVLCERVSKEINIHDHPGMCLDEFPGFLVTMFYLPHTWVWVIWGFLLFRLFDIWKPWPIDYIDKKVMGGLGMILDDIVAGLFANAILHILVGIVS